MEIWRNWGVIDFDISIFGVRIDLMILIDLSNWWKIIAFDEESICMIFLGRLNFIRMFGWISKKRLLLLKLSIDQFDNLLISKKLISFLVLSKNWKYDI